MMPFASFTGKISRRGESAPIAKLEIYDSWNRSTIELIGNSVSLLEDNNYDILLSAYPSHDLPAAMFFKPFVRSRVAIGGVVHAKLDLSRFVGRVLLEFEDSENIAPVEIFVRPRKLSYDAEFYTMLENLAEEAIELVLARSDRSDVDLMAISTKSRPTNLQQFFLLRSIFKSTDIEASLSRIARFPHTALIEDVRSQRVASGVRNTKSFAMAMVTAVERVSVPHTHPLSKKFSSIPRTVTTALRTETLNTPENRFLKFCLQTFLQFIESASRQLPPERTLYGAPSAWLNKAEALLRASLAKDFCVAAGRISLIPSASTVLQRKPGYRDILAAWSKFQSSAALSIPLIENSFAGGKRDAATLYEQWVFLQIRTVLVRSFKILTITRDELLHRTRDGFSLSIASGRKPILSGAIEIESKEIAFNLYYNRTFSARGSVREGGITVGDDTAESWSKSMRPDVTLTLWPYEAGTPDRGLRLARKSATLIHMHFDAKYRFNLKSTVESDFQLPNGTARSALDEATVVADDIDKMHAYISAIRHSIAAFVVYPGDETLIFWESAERLKAVGAVNLRPGDRANEALQETLYAAFLRASKF
jgi:predicted component of viral defense system (DUF524 family)